MVVDVDGWVSVSECARRLGVTRAAIKSRIKRGTLPSMTDNHGNPLVRVGAGAVSDGTYRKAPPDTSRQVSTDTVPVPTGSAQGVAALVSLEYVRTLLVQQQEAHCAAMASLHAAHRDAMAMMTERIDAAECRVEQLLDHLLDRHDRPWWSRLFGQSKRSNLGC